MQANNSEKSILAQLSGLKLSNGRTAAELVKFQSTPPSVAPSTPQPSAQTYHSTDVAIGGTKITDISKLLSNGAVRLGTPPPTTTSNTHTPTPAAATTAVPRSSATSANNQGGSSSSSNQKNSNATKEKESPSAKQAKALALPKPRSEIRGSGGKGNSSHSHANPNAGSGGASQGKSAADDRSSEKQHKDVPKPASASIATTTAAAAAAASPMVVVGNTALNPKVVEFFNKHAALQATAATAPTVTVGSSAPIINVGPAVSAGAASPVNNSSSPNSSGHEGKRGGAPAATQPTAEERKAALQANQFLREAFGVVDNSDAERPIIRSLPTVPAGGRYIVVGDVHGCLDQLEALIEKVRYQQGKDCLVIIGDYVNKGPDSIGVVQACMRHKALGVLGNHDYTLLKCIDRNRRKPFRPEDMRDPVKQLAKNFPLDCECYLRSLPHILKLPEYNVLLVHAGLNIQHTLLEDQNVYELMHLRRLEKIVTNDPVHHKREVVKYQAVIKGSAGVPWGELWEGPEQVIFGHDAYSGFQVHPRATGIDTGCVYGDPLTCVVFSHDSPQGEYINVPGLPKSANELKGLPPPDAEIYEQQQLELERQIIRPTPRATPSLVSNSGSPISQRPVFLSTPVSQPRPLTATITSTNARLTPASAAVAAAMAFPTSKVMTPTSVMGASTAQEVADVSAREMQKATLLALSASHELTALAVVIAMPAYESALDSMLEADAEDDVALGSFWTPFVRNTLTAAHRRLRAVSSPATPVTTTGASSLPELDTTAQLAEDALLYALGICDDLEPVRKAVQPQLKEIQADATVGAKLSKAAKKYVDILVR